MISSLFERESTGGAIAREGFEYQDDFLLDRIPRLLTESAFCKVVSESLGDVEFRYFRPGGGTLCVFYEAKQSKLTMSGVWKEVARFEEIHAQAPDEYVRFVLVCGDFNTKLGPLVRKLDRYRGTGEALNDDSSIRKAAEEDIQENIVRLGQSRTVARFVIERVSFVTYSNSNVEGGFITQFQTHLSELCDIRGSETAAFLTKCRELVKKSLKGIVHRRDLESALLDTAPNAVVAWRATPSYVALNGRRQLDIDVLAVDVASFNGPARGGLGIAEWSALEERLAEIGNFLHSTRDRQGVKISAKQRMSLACLVGYCFSAVRGFTLALEHNGQVFDTAVHDRSAAPFFGPQVGGDSSGRGSEGVVSISFPFDGKDDVKTSITASGLGDAPTYILESVLAITDMATLNSAVHEAKSAILGFRSRHQLRKIHLFVRAPSVFAMALGHRLNGVGPLQLYDWVDGKYQTTVILQ